MSERRSTVDTPITLDDQHSVSSLTSLRHCNHGDDVTSNCRPAANNCDKTSRDRGCFLINDRLSIGWLVALFIYLSIHSFTNSVIVLETNDPWNTIKTPRVYVAL